MAYGCGLIRLPGGSVSWCVRRMRRTSWNRPAGPWVYTSSAGSTMSRRSRGTRFAGRRRRAVTGGCSMNAPPLEERQEPGAGLEDPGWVSRSARTPSSMYCSALSIIVPPQRPGQFPAGLHGAHQVFISGANSSISAGARRTRPPGRGSAGSRSWPPRMTSVTYVSQAFRRPSRSRRWITGAGLTPAAVAIADASAESVAPKRSIAASRIRAVVVKSSAERMFKFPEQSFQSCQRRRPATVGWTLPASVARGGRMPSPSGTEQA